MTTPNTDHWWQAFYLGPFQELQLGGIHNDRAPAEVTLLEQNLKLEPHHRILDAPCGQGRHTLELARRGYAVTGIYFNPNVLAHAQAVAESEGLRPRFDQQDLRALSYESVFDRVLCLWGSFGYFSDTENLAQLQGMARALKPGGALHLETWTTEGLPSVSSSRLELGGGTRATFTACSKNEPSTLRHHEPTLSGRSCAKPATRSFPTEPLFAFTAIGSSWSSSEQLDFSALSRTEGLQESLTSLAPGGSGW